MLTPDFQVGRPVGTGHSRPNDVIRLRRALNETGHGSSPPDPSEVYDPSLSRTIKRFQSDYGLQQDGIVLPGGPTERMLNIALAAQRQGGDDGQAQLRDVVGAITDAGLKPEAPPPGDPRPVVFADKNGEIVSPDQILNIVRPSSGQPVGRRPDEAKVAFVPAIAAGVLGADAAWNAAAALLGLTIGGAAAHKLTESLKNRAPAKQQAIPKQPTPNGANGAQRTIDASSDATILPGPSTPPGPPPHLPTPPLTHPQFPPENVPESFPIVEGGPHILPGPKIEPAKPEIMIRQSLPDDEFWRQISILYNRPGSPETRQGNHEVGQTGVQAGQEIGEEVDFTHGGYANDGEYRSELHLRPHKLLQVLGKPLKNGSFLDVVLKHKGTGRRLLINTQSVDSAGNPTKNEQWQVDKVLLNKDTGDIFWGIPKPPKGADPKEWAQQFKERLKELIREISKPH